jgi:hypothetical protein
MSGPGTDSNTPFFFQLQDPATSKCLMYVGAGQYILSNETVMSQPGTILYIVPGKCSSIMDATNLSPGTPYAPNYFNADASGKTLKQQLLIQANGQYVVETTDTTTQNVSYLQVPQSSSQALLTYLPAIDPTTCYWNILQSPPAFKLRSPIDSSKYLSMAGSVFSLTNKSAPVTTFQVVNNWVFAYSTVDWSTSISNPSMAYLSNYIDDSEDTFQGLCCSAPNTGALSYGVRPLGVQLNSTNQAINGKNLVVTITPTGYAGYSSANPWYLSLQIVTNKTANDTIVDTFITDNAWVVEQCADTSYLVYDYMLKNNVAFDNPTPYAFVLPSPVTTPTSNPVFPKLQTCKTYDFWNYKTWNWQIYALIGIAGALFIIMIALSGALGHCNGKVRDLTK